MASCAIVSVSAATARIGWPIHIGSLVKIGSAGAGSAGTSAAVRMPSTPGSASAAAVSTLRTRACGIGLSMSFTNTMPSARKSSAYLALPVTLPCTSGGTKFFPNKS